MIKYENNKNKEARFYIVKTVIKIRVIKSSSRKMLSQSTGESDVKKEGN